MQTDVNYRVGSFCLVLLDCFCLFHPLSFSFLLASSVFLRPGVFGMSALVRVKIACGSGEPFVAIRTSPDATLHQFRNRIRESFPSLFDVAFFFHATDGLLVPVLEEESTSVASCLHETSALLRISIRTGDSDAGDVIVDPDLVRSSSNVVKTRDHTRSDV
jgi:hypothetical protein